MLLELRARLKSPSHHGLGCSPSDAIKPDYIPESLNGLAFVNRERKVTSSQHYPGRHVKRYGEFPRLNGLN